MLHYNDIGYKPIIKWHTLDAIIITYADRLIIINCGNGALLLMLFDLHTVITVCKSNNIKSNAPFPHAHALSQYMYVVLKYTPAVHVTNYTDVTH